MVSRTSNRAWAIPRRLHGDGVRSYFIFGLLVVLLVGWGVHIVLRPLPSRVIVSSHPPGHQKATAPRTQSVSSKLDETKSGRGRDSARSKARASGDDEESQTKGPSQLIDRPLKVAGLGWSTVAAGVWANNGLTPGEASHFSSDGELEVHFRIVASPLEIERALAEGGEDPEGADIAIIPLQTLVARYEDLEPLHPEIFLVTGWSKGHHAVLARQGPDVTVSITDGGARPVDEEVTLSAFEGSPAHFLALFVLDLAGIDVGQIRVLDPSSEEASTAGFVALEVPPRGMTATPGLDLLIGTEEATRAIPTVAVASRRFVEEHEEALESFALTLLRSSEEMMSQVPEAARQLGAIEGAPEALDLLGPLVRQEPVDVEDNARLAGLAGQDVVTLERLMELSFELFARAEVTGSIELARAPISTETIATIARAGLVQESRRAVRERPIWSERRPGIPLGDTDFEAVIFVPTTALGVDDGAQIERLGLVTGIIESSFLRVRRRGIEGAQLEEMVAVMVERYSLAPERIIEAENGLNAGIVILGQR